MKVLEYFKLPLYMLTHPVDGFYVMKHENRGSTGITILNIFLLWVFYSINKQYSGFVVNDIDLHALNSFIDLIAIVLLYLLWCTGNWAVTTLTEGEGKFREIAMVVSYSMTPLILALIPAALIGNLVVENEEAFYFMIIWIAIIWFLALVFVGTMSVHNYSPGKTLVTIFLTIAAMLVIIFLILLISALMQQVVMFVYSIYTELIFRT
jgi:low temperature requirement protein LtrA